MADTKISALTSYTTPLGADIIPIVDTANATTKGMTYANFSLAYRNASVTTQGPGFATDTYLIGSSVSVAVPNVKTIYHCIFDASKTAAGVAAAVVSLRFGINGSTADTALCTFTFAAQTAAADVGTIEIWATFRTVGSGTSAVVAGTAQIRHNLSATGFSTSTDNTLQVTSSGFNSTTANSILGISVNGGASAVWTVQNVQTLFTL